MSSDGTHHQKKVKVPESVLEARREKNKRRIAEYKELCESTYRKRRNGELDEEALKLTATVLSINPEHYTVWNFRREILLHLFEGLDEATKQARCKQELKLVDQALLTNPKSYWLWNHRRWTLESSPQPDWARELKLVDMLLDKDARNFHGWKYRRDVIAQLPDRTPKDEFDFSTAKIHQNFSNYSAWHYRSKQLFATFTTPVEQQKTIEQDLELVRNAVYTEPADQSAWLYQRWLLGKQPLPLTLLGTCLLRETERSAIVLSFNQPTLMSRPAAISVTIDGNEVTQSPAAQSSEYTPVHTIWLPALPKGNELVVTLGREAFRSASGGSLGGKILRKFKLGDATATVTVEAAMPIDSDPVHADEQQQDVTYQSHSIWERELKSVEELVEVEPDSKWALLTLVYMLKEVGGRDEAAVKILGRLEKLDSFRAEYYRDLKSDFLLQRAVSAAVYPSATTPSTSFTFAPSPNPLTTFSPQTISPLFTIRILDLSSNHIRSMKSVACLPLLEEINLNDNRLRRVEGVSGLRRLRILRVKGNDIRSLEGLRELEGVSGLESFEVGGNAVVGSEGWGGLVGGLRGRGVDVVL
ncbi:hypothetical protein HDV00_001490 [Rhizophlyctis rosea]|nr:hypothetical protein HDV00_001490 [Rhizophlyctis rosea]